MSEFDSPMPSVSLTGDTDGTERCLSLIAQCHQCPLQETLMELKSKKQYNKVSNFSKDSYKTTQSMVLFNKTMVNNNKLHFRQNCFHLYRTAFVIQ